MLIEQDINTADKAASDIRVSFCFPTKEQQTNRIVAKRKAMSSTTVLSQIALLEAQVRARMQDIESAELQEYQLNKELARQTGRLARATRLDALKRIESDICALEVRLVELYAAKETTRTEIRNLQDILTNLRLGNAP